MFLLKQHCFSVVQSYALLSQKEATGNANITFSKI